MSKKIIISLIIIMIIICNFQYSMADSETAEPMYYYIGEGNEILAYKQINAFKLSLADGSTLSDASISTDSSVAEIENMKPVEIVFILDNSGSMGRDPGTIDRMTPLKNAMNQLMNSLFSKIESDVKIGLIKFSSPGSEQGLYLTDNRKTLNTFINRMVSGGLTYMATSVKTAQNWLVNSENKDAVKIICTLTDGALFDMSNTINNIKSSHSNGIFTFSIFLATSIPSNFASFDKSIHQNFKTTDSGFVDTITNDIYEAIYSRAIIMQPPSTKYNITNAGIITGDDKIIMQIDEEILHGATLQIEYILSITSAFNSKEILILDAYDDPLIFNENQKMLTEDKTNADYGWQMYNGSLINYHANTLDTGQEHRVKLVLSTVITPTILQDLSKVGNSAQFRLTNSETGEVIKITGQNSNTNSSETKIKALDILIIPPTGVWSAEKKVWTLSMTVAIVSIGLIVICISDYIKTKKKSKQENNRKEN